MSQLSAQTVKTITCLWLWMCVWSSGVAAQTLSAQVGRDLHTRIAVTYDMQDIRAGKEIIRASELLVRFYEQRNYQPAWSNEGCLSPQASAVLTTIHEADREGLNPQDYHPAAIETVMLASSQNAPERCLSNPEQLADLDLLLTDAFLLYGAHLLASRLDPRTIDPLWVVASREMDLAQTLQSALETNRITETLHSLTPPYSGYTHLRQALVRYRDLATRGPWPLVPDGPKLAPGMYEVRVPTLRARLLAEGELVAESPAPVSPTKTRRKIQRKREPLPTDLPVDDLLFDKPLVEAVRNFQRRNGLSPDGTVGPGTLAALNVPVEERVRQIQMNLERWRWLPPDLGPRYILINVPDFTLKVIENGHPVLTMRAVVGRQKWRTPVFSAPMTSVVFNPHWFVPRSIAVKELLPMIRRDPGYLARQRMSVAVKSENGFRAVNSRAIKWGNVSAENFPYRFRQEPGAKNALGRMKFLLPNPFNVYLHDTPSTALFNRATRASSHGCIRLEKPLELAEYVLRGDPRWTPQMIRSTLAQQKTRSVDLPAPIPVHLFYWTAWADDDHTVHFRTDLYKQDSLLADALQRKRPAVSTLVQLPMPAPRTELSSEPAPVVSEAIPVHNQGQPPIVAE